MANSEVTSGSRGVTLTYRTNNDLKTNRYVELPFIAITVTSSTNSEYVYLNHELFEVYWRDYTIFPSNTIVQV